MHFPEHSFITRCAGPVLFALCNLAAAGVTAPTLAVGSASGPEGSTRNIAFSVSAGNAMLGGVQFELAVPPQLRANASSVAGPGSGVSVVCSIPDPSRLICLAFDNAGALLPTMFALRVDFTVVVGAGFGPVPLSLTSVEFSDPVGEAIASGMNTNGSFVVLQTGPAVFTSTPVPGTLVDFGTVLHGTAASRTVQVRNAASPDFQSMEVSSCTLSGSPAFALLQPQQFPVSVAAASSVDLIVEMVSVAQLGSEVQGTLSCQISGAPPITASWPLRAQPATESILRDGFETP